MTFESGMSGLQLRSLVKSNGELELSLVAIPTPKPGVDEVVVRVEAAPINPTDMRPTWRRSRPPRPAAAPSRPRFLPR
jgi:NADPH:quinone reductase-like Zn-dependent oxidoreductase